MEEATLGFAVDAEGGLLLLLLLGGGVVWLSLAVELFLLYTI